MTLMDQFNAFCRASQGKVGAAERGLYMTLLDIWNQLRRPEWFDVSNTQLQNILLAGSHHSVIKWRDNLEKAGFISAKYMGRGHPVKIHIEELSTADNALPSTAKNAIVEESTADNALPSTAKNAIVEESTADNALPVRQKMPYSRAKNAHITEREYTENERSLSNIVSNLEIHRPPEREAPPLPDYVWEKYLTYREPKDRENERAQLAIWTEEEGTKAVMDAIDKGIQARGKSINYIGSILHNGGDNGKGCAKRPTRRLTEEEEAAKWERAIARQREFEDEQRRKFGEGWNL